MVFATALRVASEVSQAIQEEELANPILPVGNELFWGAVTFAVLWILMKFVLLPPVLRGMERREEKARADLAAAEQAREAAAAKLAEYQASLASAKAEAVRILEDARAQAEAKRKAVMAEAEADAAAVRAQAAQEVAAAKAAARAELRESLADIVVAAAGAVVEKPLDRQAQLQIIEDYVNRAGSQN
ncbi:F0F1 ATP synthase subunit B [Rhabdothermincola sediminis]|uniref:F0F1 ATP synthase subunit B n=1 Tax=Rhabdothermincola sediminis TaxID=2751370 RepID=UPI001AA087C4|nr:F0F1 ATP synthase subunit B [Rhabdothermincola sediminis]